MMESQLKAIEKKISFELIEYYLEFGRSIEIQLCLTIEFQPFDYILSGSISSIIDPV